jgi:uncharacterized DUF497 family protein
MSLNFSKGIALKLLQKHDVTITEVEECFDNREKGLLEDAREKHQTNPPTQWFIAKTDKGRLLKVVFIALGNGINEIKTAYEPNDQEVKIYEKYA